VHRLFPLSGKHRTPNPVVGGEPGQPDSYNLLLSSPLSTSGPVYPGPLAFLTPFFDPLFLPASVHAAPTGLHHTRTNT